jgi:hypothetical protein
MKGKQASELNVIEQELRFGTGSQLGKQFDPAGV